MATFGGGSGTTFVSTVLPVIFLFCVFVPFSPCTSLNEKEGKQEDLEVAKSASNDADEQPVGDKILLVVPMLSGVSTHG